MSELSQHVLAAYYSDARLNILFCLNDIRQKMGKKPMRDDAEIVSAFTSLSLANTTPELQKELIFQLRKRFPFLDVLTDASPEELKKHKQQDKATPQPDDFATQLEWMFRLINSLRNSTVHPTDEETTFDHKLHKQLSMTLGRIYDASLDTTTQRFEYIPEVIEPFRRYVKAAMVKQKGKKKSKKQNKPTLKTIATFSLALCTKPASDEQTLLKQSQVMHDFSHVFFCSFFLEKSQSAGLIHAFWQTGAGADWYDEEKAIIKSFLAIYNVRLPRQRLKSDETLTALTLDSLAELSRCPRRLLKTLSKQDKERFRVIAADDDRSAISNHDVVNDDTETSKSSHLFTRGHQDRFIPFMMRYLDFDPQCQLRFALDLGQFYYNVRLKPADRFTDGKPRVRRLGQKIICYARLRDIEQAQKPEDWQQLEQNYIESLDEQESHQATDDIQSLKPYLVPTFPHYHYFKDKIGLRLAENEQPVGYPDLQAHQAKHNICLQAPTGQSMQPEFWLSPSHMMHIVFYYYLQKAVPKPTTTLPLDIILRRYRSGMIKLLQSLITGTPHFAGEPFSTEKRQAAQQWINRFFNLNHQQQVAFSVTLADLPKVLVHHLVGKGNRQISLADCQNRLAFLIDETKAKQEHINKLLQRAKKRGKKGFKAIKCGYLGDFLADDLMRFQPIDSSKPDGGKINSQQYQILQAALAYYGAHINEPPKIVDLLHDAGLLTGAFAHPFLSKLKLEQQPDRYRGLISFYIAYLKAREKYLTQYTLSANHIPKWLGIRQQSTLNNWLKNYTDDTGKLEITRGRLKQPLPLPKHMLYQPLLSMAANMMDITKKALYQQGMQTFTRKGQQVEIRPTISWMIRRVLAHQGDRAQAMYNYSRQHDLFDSYYDKRQSKKYYLPESQRIKVLAKIKQVIQQQKDTKKAQKLHRLLKSFYQQEKKLRHSVTQDILLYLYASQHLNQLQLSDHAPKPQWTLQGMQKTLLKTEIVYQLPVPDTNKQLFHPQCKIRNLGEMRLLVQDRRLPSLLPYYSVNERVLHHDEIRAELNSYRRMRLKVMALVHQLEHDIVQCCHSIKIVPTAYKDDFGIGRHGQFLYTLYALYQQQHEQNTPTDQAILQAFTTHAFVITRLIRNAFAHSIYPDQQDFRHITTAIRKETPPENPANHRQVAARLVQELEHYYAPWYQFLATYKTTPSDAEEELCV